jgi:hypothetical protein
MKTMILSMRTIALRAIRDMAIDGILGAVSGGLFGMVFGGFGALLHGESWRLVSIAGTFALCGAVAGALWGGCSGIFNSNEKRSESNDFSREGIEEYRTPLEPVDHLMDPSQCQPQKSLTATTSSDRRRMQIATTKHPLSC